MDHGNAQIRHAKRRGSVRLAVTACVLAPALAVAETGSPPTASPQPFETCRTELIAWATARAVPQRLAEAQLGNLTPDPDVLAATGSQGEFVRPIWDYIEASVTPARIEAGQRKLAEHADTLAAIEAKYGVDRHIIVAFWGVESSYGAVLDNPAIVKPVVRSLATLGCGDSARAPYWRDELAAALQILAWNQAPLDRIPAGLTGSWAGAMGHTQFMPSVYQRDAVDFDGDGTRDIWTSVPDALASTANYLRVHGWKPGDGWGTEAVLPERFDAALADETTARSVAAWRALGVIPAHGRPMPDDAQATLILPAGIRGLAFLIQPNFAVILRYNTALSYALTVALLSDRLRGDPALARDWPRGDRTLTADERRDLQTRLIARGYDVGEPDGKVGSKTREAIKEIERQLGMPATGRPGGKVLEALRRG